MRSPLVLACLALLAAIPASADYRDHYKAGLDAIEAQQWAAAEGAMRNAIDENPESAGRLSGLGLRRYLPHFHLGWALAEQGKCRPALEAFAEAVRREEATKGRESDILRARQSECRALVQQVEAEAQSAADRLSSLAGAAKQIAELGDDPILAGIWERGSPSLADRSQEIRTELGGVGTQLDQARIRLDIPAIRTATETLKCLSSDLESLEIDARGRREELRSSRQAQLDGLESLVSSAESDLRFIRFLEPYPPGLADRRQAVLDSIALAGSVGLATPVGEIDQTESALRRDLELLRRAVRRPPDKLVDALAAYQNADYQGVLETLAEAQFSDPRARAHACVFEASARHALALLSALPNEGLAEAEAALEECFATEPPPFDPSFFHPAFAELLRARQATTGEPAPG